MIKSSFRGDVVSDEMQTGLCTLQVTPHDEIIQNMYESQFLYLLVARITGGDNVDTVHPAQIVSMDFVRIIHAV